MSKLTIIEARRNLAEMKEVLDDDHVEEIERLLDEKEAERIREMNEEEFREEFADIIADGSD